MMGRLHMAIAALALLATAQVEAASGKPKPHPIPLLEFNQKCVVKALELNYGSYNRQLQDLQLACMTDKAYVDWRSSLERAGIMNQLKTTKGGLVLSANVGAGQILQEGVRALANKNRYAATIKTPVHIVFNGDLARARTGYVETDVIRILQHSRPVGYAIHAIRLNITK